MKNRISILMLLGVLTFGSVAQVGQEVVKAATQDEINSLGNIIQFQYVNEGGASIKSLKSDLYVIGSDGENYYRLNKQVSNDDGKITSYNFADEYIISLESYSNDLATYLASGDSALLSASEFNSGEDVRGIISLTSKPIKEYYFFDNNLNLVGKFEASELGTLIDNASTEVQNIEFTASVLGYPSSNSATVELVYKLPDGSIPTRLNLYYKDELVDMINIDETNNTVSFNFAESGTYTLGLEVDGRESAKTNIELIQSEVEAPQEGTETEIEEVEVSTKKPKVTFKGDKKETEEGNPLIITMKTNIACQMRFDSSTYDDYSKSHEFEVTQNGTYEYTVVSEAGVETSGELKITCFVAPEGVEEEPMLPEVEVTEGNTQTRLPQTGKTALGLILAVFGCLFSGVLIKKGVKKNEQEK